MALCSPPITPSTDRHHCPAFSIAAAVTAAAVAVTVVATAAAAVATTLCTYKALHSTPINPHGNVVCLTENAAAAVIKRVEAMPYMHHPHHHHHSPHSTTAPPPLLSLPTINELLLVVSLWKGLSAEAPETPVWALGGVNISSRRGDPCMHTNPQPTLPSTSPIGRVSRGSQYPQTEETCDWGRGPKVGGLFGVGWPQG